MKDLQTIYTEYESSYSEPNIRSKGREDGERGAPPLDLTELSPYESEILHSAQLVASKVVGVCRSKMESIDAAIKADLDKADRKLKDDEARINSTYDANKSLHEQSHDLKAARDVSEQSKKRFDVLFGKIGRLPIAYVPHWLYLIFATAIFLGEIPLNAMVFQIFGENQVMTWVMAFVIGLSIPLCSHFVGIKAREHYPAVSWTNVGKAIVVAVMVGIALYGLAVMRHDYLLSMKEELGLDDRLIETSYLFFWLNIAVFGAAIIIGYLAHDPVPGYQEVRKEFLAAQKKLAKEEEKRANGLKWIESARANELDRARAEYRDSISAVFKLKGEYDQALTEGRENENRCLHQMMKDISVYRHENMRSRKDSKVPPCFSIQAKFPTLLDSLSEKLLNDKDSHA